jgi:hypothetical protein
MNSNKNCKLKETGMKSFSACSFVIAVSSFILFSLTSLAAVGPNGETYTDFFNPVLSTDAEGANIITSIPKTAKGDFTVYANWVEGEEKIYSITYYHKVYLISMILLTIK